VATLKQGKQVVTKFKGYLSTALDLDGADPGYHDDRGPQPTSENYKGDSSNQ
jgi:hypothetical protein